jgi:hypothetical protein
MARRETAASDESAVFYLSGLLVPKPKGQHTMKKPPIASHRIFADHRDHPFNKNHGALGWKEAA